MATAAVAGFGSMSPGTPTRLTQAVADAIRQQLGTDAVVLITPGEFTCAVVVATAPSNALDPVEPDAASGISMSADRLAYSVPEAARALGVSRDVTYDEMRAGRLESLKVGRRRIITRRQIEDFLVRLGR